MSAENQFWEWFNENQPFVFHYEKDKDKIFAGIQRELAKVHPGLTFEIGAKQDDQREFVISADGVRTLFPHVMSLVAAAPDLSRWKITAFRPRRRADIQIGYGDLQFSPERVEFSAVKEDGQLDVTVYLEGYDEKDARDFQTIAWIMMEHLIGEYDLETKVKSIHVESPEAMDGGQRRKLAELPDLVDRLGTVS